MYAVHNHLFMYYMDGLWQTLPNRLLIEPGVVNQFIIKSSVVIHRSFNLHFLKNFREAVHEEAWMDKCGQWNRNGWCYKLCSGQWDLPKSLKPATHTRKSRAKGLPRQYSSFPILYSIWTQEKKSEMTLVFRSGLFWKHMQINIM